MENEFTTKHVLEGRELIEYLAERSASNANIEIVKREERRSRRMGMLVALLGAGTGTFFYSYVASEQEKITNRAVATVQSKLEKEAAKISKTMRTFAEQEAQTIKSEIEKNIQATIGQQVEQQVGNVSRQLRHYKLYQELIALADTIREEEEVNHRLATEEMQIALKHLDELADAQEIREQHRFLAAAATVIQLLVRTDQYSDIAELEEKLRSVFIANKSFAIELADHYGQLIVASPYSVDTLQSEYESLLRYTSASRELGYPEKALMWELFVAYKRNNFATNSVTNGLVEMVQDLSEGDLQNFCYQMFLNSDPLYWMKRPDQEGRQMARLVNGLMEDYPTLRQTVGTMLQTEALKTEVDKLVRRKTRRLERLQAETSGSVPHTAGPPEDDNALRR